MLCRVYVIGRVKKLLGVCWIGWVPETGDTLFVKLFQDDVDRFMAYDPLELAREAIDEGENFLRSRSFLEAVPGRKRRLVRRRSGAFGKNVGCPRVVRRPFEQQKLFRLRAEEFFVCRLFILR